VVSVMVGVYWVVGVELFMLTDSGHSYEGLSARRMRRHCYDLAVLYGQSAAAAGANQWSMHRHSVMRMEHVQYDALIKFPSSSGPLDSPGHKHGEGTACRCRSKPQMQLPMLILVALLFVVRYP